MDDLKGGCTTQWWCGRRGTMKLTLHLFPFNLAHSSSPPQIGSPLIHHIHPLHVYPILSSSRLHTPSMPITRDQQHSSPRSKVPHHELSNLGLLRMLVSEVIVTAFKGSYNRFCEQYNVQGLEDKIRYQCNYLINKGAWDDQAPLPQEPRES